MRTSHSAGEHFGQGGATAFRQWGQDFLFISFTACSLNFSGGNNRWPDKKSNDIKSKDKKSKAKSQMQEVKKDKSQVARSQNG